MRATQLSTRTQNWQRTQRRRCAAVVCSLPPEYKTKLQNYKVFVAGATGRTGKEVVNALQDLEVPVRALVRDPANSKLLQTSVGLEVVKGDVFQYSSLPNALGDANAIIVATGANNPLDPAGPFNVDFQGTLNLVALASQRKIKKFILVTSIGTDDLLNPLNLFWGVLFWKKRAEEQLQRSGLDFTIVRPGGLRSELRQGEAAGEIVMKPAGYYGVPPARNAATAGAILRKQVAEVCVAALVEPDASNKVVEIIATKDAPARSFEELFKSVE